MEILHVIGKAISLFLFMCFLAICMYNSKGATLGKKKKKQKKIGFWGD